MHQKNISLWLIWLFNNILPEIIFPKNVELASQLCPWKPFVNLLSSGWPFDLQSQVEKNRSQLLIMLLYFHLYFMSRFNPDYANQITFYWISCCFSKTKNHITEIVPRAIKYPALVLQSLVFIRKAKNINYDRGTKVKLEIQKILEASCNCVETASVNLLASVCECRITI